MPRFFFHVYDGRIKPDREGIDLPGWIAARDEAVRLIGRWTQDAVLPGPSPERRYVDVTDDAGLLLFRLDRAAVDRTAAAGDAAEDP